MATDIRDVDNKLDENLLSSLPEGGKVVSVEEGGYSDYCNTFNIKVEMPDGSSQMFFEKESRCDMGKYLIESAWISETSLYEFIPENVPRPHKTGAYMSSPNTYFFLAEFVDMRENAIPKARDYMAAVANLHTRSMGESPTGMFGFAVNTRFGDLEQHNGWNSSWEAFWTSQMRQFLDREERVRGPHDAELVQLKQTFFEKVLPRYLRPLESEGRSIKPCLLHGDLWPGNVKYRLDGKSVCIYDASAIWGHNEVDLGVFQNDRYPFGDPYLNVYNSHVQYSEPRTDAKSRITMYMMRNQVLLSTLYPTDPELRERFVKIMRSLCEQVVAEEQAEEASRWLRTENILLHTSVMQSQEVE